MASATSITNVSHISGSGTDRNYTAGATTRVYIVVASEIQNRLVDGILTSLDQDGTLKADAVDVTAVIKDAIITRPKLATGFATEFTKGWIAGDLPAVSSVTALGNRSYTVSFASDVSGIISEGMKLRTTRTSAATTNAFSLDGGNDYYVKTSPNKLTFTDDFSVSAWVYLTAYQAGNIVSRYNGTSGWELIVLADGTVRISGYSGGAANFRSVISYQSIPLNRWVHIAAQLDMGTHTISPTTGYIMIDGVNVPAQLASGGTLPTSLLQAGNLEIGSRNGGTTLFTGYLDQVAIYSAKVTQATHLAAMHQGLTGSETSLASAYANGSTTDLNTTNANNLTAQNGATTVASAPWGNRGASSTLDFGVVMKVATTDVTVQVPEGCTIPTTGGISAVAYSVQSNPYGWIGDPGRWRISTLFRTDQVTTSNATYGSFISGGAQLYAPIGTYRALGYRGNLYNSTTTPVTFNMSDTSLTGLSTTAGANASTLATCVRSSAAATTETPSYIAIPKKHTSAATYIMYTFGATTSAGINGTSRPVELFADPAYI